MDLEQIIDEISNRLKSGRDISRWQASNELAPITNLLYKLAGFPKARIPAANHERIRNQILDRIASPIASPVETKSSLWSRIPNLFKISSGLVGSLLIVISLTMGTAVAALQSVPGQPIYPLKKIVENVQLKLTSDPATRANLQIQFANNRLDELTAVLEKNQSGEISSSDAQRIVTQAVNDLQKSTAAALRSSTVSSSDNKKPQVNNLTKIVDLSNKQTAVLQPLLTAASISNDGDVKIVLEKALETSNISKEQAIQNIENAGLKIEDQPIAIVDPANQISATGKVTVLTADNISIGTAKFLVTKTTQYVNIKSADLKVNSNVKITGEVGPDKKTYALTITSVETTDTTTPPTSSATSTDTTPNPTSSDTQSKTDTGK